MRNWYFTTGSTVLTNECQMKVTGYDGAFVFLDMYDYNFHKIGKCKLTLDEMTSAMNDFYGDNFKAIWVDKFD